MDLIEYINKNTIVTIGSKLPQYLFSEIIVENPNEMINLVCASDYFISEILWWEYAEIGVGPTIGYGGPRDPRSPETNYFAETDIQKNFSSNTTEIEYLNYLGEVHKTFPELNLFPAFTIKALDNNTGDGSVSCSDNY